MADDFPTEYDAIVLGTGLPESVVAAALARVGKTVLHLDRNDYYSSEWTTFTFDGLLNWIKVNQDQSSVASGDTSCIPRSDGEHIFPLPERSNTITNVVANSYLRTKRKEMQPSATEESSVAESEISKAESDTSEQGSTEDDEEEKQEKSGDQEEQDGEKETDTPEHGDTPENTLPCNTGDIDMSQENTTETIPTPEHDATVENIATQSGSETGQENTSGAAQPLSMPTPRLRSPKSKPPVNKDMTYEDLEKYFRQFNIDLAPKMLFSRGPLVEAIISANISHYAEFKAVNRIITYLSGNIEDVPCSRSDVFSSKLISAIEKRTLMKYLTFCIDFENHEDEYREFVDKPFVEFLQSRRLTPNLQHFVLHAIAMLPPETATPVALKATRSFLQSLGRYGNSPFIWPLYGVGELPQAFCRMCAVFGGLYCLRRSAESLTVDASSNTCVGITSDGQFLKCKWLIMENSYLPMQWSRETTKYVARAVFITDKSLKASEHGAVTLMTMPRTSDKGSPISVMELDKSTAACPSGLYVIHLVTDGCSSAVEDLQATAEELLYFPQCDDDRESPKPVVLWSLYFNHSASDQPCIDPALPSNVYCTSLPGSSLGFGHAMHQAKQIFQNICGSDEEFLPAIPNPEDIIMDDFLAEEQGNNSGLVGGSGSGHDDDNPPNPSSEEQPSVEANAVDNSPNTDTHAIESSEEQPSVEANAVDNSPNTDTHAIESSEEQPSVEANAVDNSPNTDTHAIESSEEQPSVAANAVDNSPITDTHAIESSEEQTSVAANAVDNSPNTDTHATESSEEQTSVAANAVDNSPNTDTHATESSEEQTSVAANAVDNSPNTDTHATESSEEQTSVAANAVDNSPNTDTHAIESNEGNGEGAKPEV